MARNLVVTRFDWGQSPDASASGAGWEANAPVTNVLIARPQLTAISTGGSASVTIDLGGTRLIGLVHLQNLITGSDGSVIVSAGAWSTGAVDAWAVDDPLEWSALGRPRFFLPPEPVEANSISVDITAGSSSTIALGFVGACEIWESPINMEYGWGITPIDLADVQRVPFGSVFVIRRGITRRLNLGVGFLRQGGIYGLGVTDDNVFSQTLAAAVISGRSLPIAVVPMPDDVANLERTSVWGLSSHDQPFSNPFFATWQTSYQIDQLI